MLKTLIDTALLSLRAPRSGARAIMDMIDGYEGVAVLFGIAFSLTAILTLIGFSIAPQSVDGGSALEFVFLNLFVSIAAFAFTTGAVYVVGKMFGGAGSFLDVATVMAWHSLITVVFSPFLSPEALMSEGAGAGLQLALIGVAFWLLVNFIAEAHRFQSAWRVAGVMLGGVFVAGVVLPLLLIGSI